MPKSYRCTYDYHSLCAMNTCKCECHNSSKPSEGETDDPQHPDAPKEA